MLKRSSTNLARETGDGVPGEALFVVLFEPSLRSVHHNLVRGCRVGRGYDDISPRHIYHTIYICRPTYVHDSLGCPGIDPPSTCQWGAGWWTECCAWKARWCTWWGLGCCSPRSAPACKDCNTTMLTFWWHRVELTNKYKTTRECLNTHNKQRASNLLVVRSGHDSAVVVHEENRVDRTQVVVVLLTDLACSQEQHQSVH